MNSSVLAAMSGGVDSTAAAALLLESGLDVRAATMRLRGVPDESEQAKKICAMLGIPHETVDLSDVFYKEVVDYFVRTYLEGGTPNPCVRCNKAVKFGALLDYAVNTGCDRIASGHYARVEKSGNRYLLKKAAYTEKDQSYVLWRLGQEQLSRMLLPVGGLTKPQVRELVETLGLPNSRAKESQDVCFVTDGDYAAFIEDYTSRKLVPGSFIDSGGKVLGTHSGFAAYTIGQRKGLGISAPRPLFVLGKDAENNTVTLGEHEMLMKGALTAKNLNLIAAERLDAPLRVEAKTRYSQREAPATVIPLGEGRVRVEFDSPQRALTPGQSVVFYDGETVVGGAEIEPQFDR